MDISLIGKIKVNSKVIVTDKNGAVLFKCRFVQFRGGELVLSPDYEEFSGDGAGGGSAAIKRSDEFKGGDENDDNYMGKKPVKLTIMCDMHGIFILKGIITYILPSRMHIGKLKLLENVQRRNDVKSTVNVPGMIYPVQKSNELPMPVAPEPIEVVFCDISAGGLRIRSKVELEIQGIYSTIYHDQAFDFKKLLKIKVLHRVPGTDENKFYYGCCFDNISLGDEQIIRGYVFNQLSKKAEQTRRRYDT